METYFVNGKEEHKMTAEWAIVMLERAYNHIVNSREIWEFGEFGEPWTSTNPYDQALCILQACKTLVRFTSN
jgi:hypothetical protein